MIDQDFKIGGVPSEVEEEEEIKSVHSQEVDELEARRASEQKLRQAQGREVPDVSEEEKMEHTDKTSCVRHLFHQENCIGCKNAQGKKEMEDWKIKNSFRLRFPMGEVTSDELSERKEIKEEIKEEAASVYGSQDE